MYPLKKTTNKLFYGSWPYKIKCRINGISLTRSHNIESIISHSESFKIALQNHINRSFYRVNHSELMEFLSIYKNYADLIDVKKRIEGNCISLYLKSYDLYQTTQKDFKKFLIEISEPENETDLQTLLEDKKYNLCNSLPHGKYRFKITFKEMPVKVRNDLIQWAEKYNNDEIFVTKSTRKHLKSAKYTYGSYYVYVKDPKMITLVAMAASGYIRRTDEFVLRPGINTDINQ